MESQLKIDDIYDKSVNFLIGSGASFGLFPTLSLGIKDNNKESQTIEKLATLFEKEDEKSKKCLLFMHYYKECIEPVIEFNLEKIKHDEKKLKVIENYKNFIKTLLTMLRRKPSAKTCNLFTTNYDGCLAHACDELLRQRTEEFIINDGARGFQKRYLHAKNYSSFVCQTGIFGTQHTELPQINIIHLHGSIYWQKEEENIRIIYSNENNEKVKINSEEFDYPEGFSECLLDSTKKIEDLPNIVLEENLINNFWNSYNRLPIVNPTKWKFYETVFEEHYYQMLRLLSYELEKPNCIFITFGFSFADEHILNLVKRSLANPSLQLFICCFNDKEHENMAELFKTHNNVTLISTAELLDFTRFNEEVFCTPKTETI